MNKGKSITLLSIIGVLMAVLCFFTFVPFDMGIQRYNAVLGAIETEYDISGGTAYTLTLAEDNINEVDDISDVTDELSERLKTLGYDVFKITAYKDTDSDVKDYDIRIEIKAPTNEYGEADTTTLKSDIDVVAAYGDLKFYGGSSSNPTDEILEDVKVIEDASYVGVSTVSSSTTYQVEIKFSSEAYDYLEEQMEAGSFYLKITLGDTTLFSGSSALSSSYFDGRTIQLSSSSETAAKQLALQIKYGALDYKYDVSNGVTITSPYGADFFLAAIIAVCVILVAAIVFFAIKYRGFGLIAALVSYLFIVIELWMMLLVPGIKMSVGGIVGIVFATVLCVDGLTVIIKRIDEEHAKGKTVKFAVTTGLKRALKPILASGIVCAIASVALYFLSSGTLKGFAITFGIGTAVSLVSTLLFTRMFIALIMPLIKGKSFYKLTPPSDGQKIVDEAVKEGE